MLLSTWNATSQRKERAISHEKPKQKERAIGGEKTIDKERARVSEKPIIKERKEEPWRLRNLSEKSVLSR